MLVDDIFIYHLDAELIKLYIKPSRYNQIDVDETFDCILKVAFLLCKNQLLIPASNFFESDGAFKSISYFAPLQKYNVIRLVSTSGDLESLLKKKENEHGENVLSEAYHYKEYIRNDNGLYLPGTLSKRKRSSSKDIEEGWLNSIGDSNIWQPYFDQIEFVGSFSEFDQELALIPERLGKRAYLSDYIVPLLSIDDELKKPTNRFVNVLVTREYIASFLREYVNATVLCDIPYIDSREILPELCDREYISYANYLRKLRRMEYRGMSALQYIMKCSAEELFEFKYSDQWKGLFDAESKDAMYIKKNTMNGVEKMNNNEDIRIGIITALPEEYVAIKTLLVGFEDYNKSSEKHVVGKRYTLGEVVGRNGKRHKIALSLLPDMGNNMASIVATKMMEEFPYIDSIIMVGIAGGIPEIEHLGDVVVSTAGAFQYDYGKNERDCFIERDIGAPCSLYLKEAVRYLQVAEIEEGPLWRKKIEQIGKNLGRADFVKPQGNGEEYYALCEESREYEKKYRPFADAPSVHYGKIGAANCVQKDPEKRDKLYKEHKVLAIEMEAGGIKDSAQANAKGFLVIRGICDFCDGAKGDGSHNYAASTAAAYLIALLESLDA